MNPSKGGSPKRTVTQRFRSVNARIDHVHDRITTLAQNVEALSESIKDTRRLLRDLYTNAVLSTIAHCIVGSTPVDEEHRTTSTHKHPSTTHMPPLSDDGPAPTLPKPGADFEG